MGPFIVDRRGGRVRMTRRLAGLFFRDGRYDDD